MLHGWHSDVKVATTNLFSSITKLDYVNDDF